MGGMKLSATPLAGMYEIRTSPFSDARGRFTRLFCEQALAPIRPNLHFTQINLSETRGIGTVRGLHYQIPPVGEAKMVRCVRGCIFDVAVDLRADSPTFLHWHALELAGDNDKAVFIPEGFAHGFQTLTEEADVLYLHTAPWTPAYERGLRHDDPRLSIAWPKPAMNLSGRDRGYAPIDATFAGLRT